MLLNDLTFQGNVKMFIKLFPPNVLIFLVNTGKKSVYNKKFKIFAVIKK